MVLIVRFMGHKPKHKDHPSIKMNGSDQPMRISLNIENVDRVPTSYTYRVYIIKRRL